MRGELHAPAPVILRPPCMRRADLAASRPAAKHKMLKVCQSTFVPRHGCEALNLSLQCALRLHGRCSCTGRRHARCIPPPHTNQVHPPLHEHVATCCSAACAAPECVSPATQSHTTFTHTTFTLAAHAFSRWGQHGIIGGGSAAENGLHTKYLSIQKQGRGVRAIGTDTNRSVRQETERVSIQAGGSR